MKECVVVVDYGMGNLQSVVNAFSSLNVSVKVVSNPNDLSMATHIVLPGVGAFANGIDNLVNNKWVESLYCEVIQKKKPFLGICLGMQLLATISHEYGMHKGLNWISGSVKKIESLDSKLRIPHVGWNEVRFLGNDPIYDGLGKSETFYFLHSYILIPEDNSVITGMTNYGCDFVSSIRLNNITATQFHPEKSHKAGLTVLRNFIKQNA